MEKIELLKEAYLELEKVTKSILEGCEIYDTENYAFSKIFHSPKRIGLAIYHRSTAPVTKKFQGMFTEEMKRKEEKLDDIVCFIVHKQTFTDDKGFVSNYGYMDAGCLATSKTKTPLNVNIVGISADQLLNLKDDEKRYVVRHEIGECVLKENDVPRIYEIKHLKGNRSLNWYEQTRNVAIDTGLILEEPKVSTPMFRFLKRELVKQDDWLKGFKLTETGEKERINVVMSLLTGLDSARATTPFKLSSEKISGGFKGALNSYYVQLDRIAKAKENRQSPIGTRFRYELEDELHGFRVVDNKLADSFCQHMYNFIDNFVSQL